jgi:hypothetical protein
MARRVLSPNASPEQKRMLLASSVTVAQTKSHTVYHTLIAIKDKERTIEKVATVWWFRHLFEERWTQYPNRSCILLGASRSSLPQRPGSEGATAGATLSLCLPIPETASQEGVPSNFFSQMLIPIHEATAPV